MITEWKDSEQLNDTAISRCDWLSNKLIENKATQDALNDDLKSLREDADKYESELQRILEHFQKTSWKTSNGAIELRKRISVRTPKTPEEKKAFFEWCQKKGVFWEVCGVNSQTLNALFKSEMEIAQQEGKDFSMPGIPSPEEFTQVIVKRSKG